MKPTLKFMIGLPSSGKSTYAEKLKEVGYTVHALDALRIELYGNVNTFDKNGELFNELHKRIKKDLTEGKNVIYDATGINRKKRMIFLDYIKNVDCIRQAVVMATPYNMCVQSDRQREKKVGSDVIKRMYFNFQFPMMQEGWDKLHLVYHPDIDWDNEEYHFGKAVNKLRHFKQFNEHHKLTIGEHCLKTARILMFSEKSPIELFWAGTLHDLGKAKTFSFENSKGEFTEFAHFYQHHSVSAYDAMFYLAHPSLIFKNQSNVLVTILTIIAEHMQPHLLKEEKPRKKYIEMVGEEFWDLLMIFNQADTDAKE